MKKSTTSRLFYNKWPYKIICMVENSWMIKRLGVARTLDFCLNKSYHPRKSSAESKELLLNFTKDIESFLKDDLQIRAEGRLFSIYCKDTDLYDTLVKNLHTYIYEVIEPANAQELEYMIDNGHKKILCNQLPHQKYRYKVYFKSGCNLDIKSQFGSWIRNYSTKVRIARSTKNWFTSGWISAPFIQFEDRPTLAMVGLFMAGSVVKVEEFILRSSINTCLNQEQVCQHSVLD